MTQNMCPIPLEPYRQSGIVHYFYKGLWPPAVVDMPCGDADYPIDRVILILSGLSRTHSKRLKTITRNERGKRCWRFRRVRTRLSVPGKNRLHPLPPVCVACNSCFLVNTVICFQNQCVR